LSERAVPIIQRQGWRRKRNRNGAYEHYYGGYDLVLTRSGKFVDLTFTGGQVPESKSYIREAKPVYLSPLEALEGFWYSDIMSGLAKAHHQAVVECNRRKNKLEQTLRLIECACQMARATKH
jgi:hypothetical protein